MRKYFTGLGVLTFGAMTFTVGYALAQSSASTKHTPDFYDAVDRAVRDRLKKAADEIVTERIRQRRVDTQFDQIVHDNS